jgi:hypothetical protein
VTSAKINRFRLVNQHIAGFKFSTPADLIEYLVGIQAQDYQQSNLAICVRLKNCTGSDVEEAISERKIIRTWPMRGTLHMVSASDIHWLLRLFKEKRISANQFRYRQLELDSRILNRSNKILEEILEGGNQLTRDEIKISLLQEGIKVDSMQLYHILHNASAEMLICFGNRRGKQFTYSLLDECVEEKKRLSREESLAELAFRYFRSRGPATINDFTWWSGLSLTDARAGLESVESKLLKEKLEDEIYWFSSPPSGKKIKPLYLLPAFDEYLIAYKNREASLDPLFEKRLIFINGMFNPMLVINGKVCGTWKRIIKKEIILFELTPFFKLTQVHINHLKKEVKRYQKFFEMKTELKINDH